MLLIAFIFLAGSGVALFIFSNFADGSSALEIMQNNVGNAHAFFAAIVIILIVLHIRGNLRLLKRREQEYEEKIKQLQEKHNAELKKLKDIKKTF